MLVLLSKLKHLKIIDLQNHEGETALHVALSSINNPTVFTLLLSVGADPSRGNKCGNTPLHLAIQNGKLDACLSLITKDTVNKANDGKLNVKLFIKDSFTVEVSNYSTTIKN